MRWLRFDFHGHEIEVPVAQIAREFAASDIPVVADELETRGALDVFEE